MGPSVLRHTAGHVLVDVDVLDQQAVATIDDATEHHLRRVLRLRDGAEVGVTDGAGRWRLAQVAVADRSMTLPWVSDLFVEARAGESITIASAVPKGDRFDWLVQKVTELGVDRLVLLDAERSVVQWSPDRVAHHLGRANRIADAALQQSRRVWRLEITAPVPAIDLLADFAVAEPGGRPLGPNDRSVAIGPEGGWSPTELAVATDLVGLTPTVLRTETAAVAAAAALAVVSTR